MDKTGNLDPVREGLEQGLLNALRSVPEHISFPNGRLSGGVVGLFNMKTDPLAPRDRIYIPDDATIGKSVGSYLIVMEETPSRDGGTRQVIEMGNGVVSGSRLKKEMEFVPCDLKDSDTDNIRIAIERNNEGVINLSASVDRVEIDGFNKVDQKRAAAFIGEAIGKLKLTGEPVPVAALRAGMNRLVTEANNERNPDLNRRGTFNRADIQAALKARQGAVPPS